MRSRARGSFLATVLVAALVAPSAAATTKERAQAAVSYIVRQQREDGSVPALSSIGSTADAVIAMAAARRGARAIDRAVDYLVDNESEVDSIGEIGKVAMALEAVDRDARDFAGRDLVDEIEGSVDGSGRLGEGSTVFEHALGILGLASADADVPAAVSGWLEEAQCADGGWQFQEPASESEDEHCSSGEGDYDRSNVDTTALAIQALEAAGAGIPPADPFAFLEASRDPRRKGWGYDASFTLTNANSTALAIQAYAAAGRPLPEGAMRSLKRLQYRLCGKSGGAFAFTYQEEDGRLERTRPDVGATVAAIPGLLRKPLPLTGVTVGRGARRPRIC